LVGNYIRGAGEIKVSLALPQNTRGGRKLNQHLQLSIIFLCLF